MTEEKYSNREIDRMMNTFSDKLGEVRDDLSKEIADYAARDKTAHEQFGAILLRVEGKQDYTNGKVGELVRWRERATGGAMVAGAFMVFVILPLAAWAIYTIYNYHQATQQQIQQAVNDVFDTRVKSVTQ